MGIPSHNIISIISLQQGVIENAHFLAFSLPLSRVFLVLVLQNSYIPRGFRGVLLQSFAVGLKLRRHLSRIVVFCFYADSKWNGVGRIIEFSGLH